MPYPGPWIQGPDFQAGFTRGPNGHVLDGVADIGHFRVERNLPTHNFTPEEISDVALAATNSGDLVEFGGGANALVEWFYDPSGFGNYLSVIEGWANYGLRVVRPTAQPGNPVLDDVPSNAIGVEWEGEHTLLSAVLDSQTSFFGSAHNLAPEGENIPSWTTSVLAAPPDSLVFDGSDRIEDGIANAVPYGTVIAEVDGVGDGFGSAIPRTLDTSVDILPWVGEDGRTVLFTKTLSAMSPDGDLNGPSFGAHYEYAHGFLINTIRIVRMFRPARHRWILEGDEPAPYRRTFPRRDGMAGGAGRNFPPSGALSTSNRTSGYL